MKDIITIAAVNFDPVWGDSEDNLKRMLEHIEAQAKQGCDLIVFPETALTGYDDETGKLLEEKMHRRLAQTVPGPSTDAVCELTKKYGIYVVYGLAERDAQDTSKVYNAAAVCGPDGVIGCCRKIFPLQSRTGRYGGIHPCSLTRRGGPLEWGSAMIHTLIRRLPDMQGPWVPGCSSTVLPSEHLSPAVQADTRVTAPWNTMPIPTICSSYPLICTEGM